MLNQKSFLAVDFGAGTLKVADFEVNEVGGLRLKEYGMKSLGPEGAQDATREAAILKAWRSRVPLRRAGRRAWGCRAGRCRQSSSRSR